MRRAPARGSEKREPRTCPTAQEGGGNRARAGVKNKITIDKSNGVGLGLGGQDEHCPRGPGTVRHVSCSASLHRGRGGVTIGSGKIRRIAW